MQVVLAIISLGLLGVIIYFLVSPKSSRLLRLSAIIALALIGLSLGVCGVVLIFGPEENEEEFSLPFLTEETEPAKDSNLGMIIGFLVAFIAISGITIYAYKKEQKRKDVPKKEKKRENPQLFQASPDPVPEQKPSQDDSFDLGL